MFLAQVTNHIDSEFQVNMSNKRWLCTDLTEVFMVMHIMFTSAVMLLQVANSEGHVILPPT